MKIFIFTILLLASYSHAFAENVKGKMILLTAANGELGEAIAFSLAAQGYNLIISGRNPAKIDNLLNNLKNASPRPVPGAMTAIGALLTGLP